MRFTSCLDKSFVYRPAVKTDVQETWKRYGWRPKQEAKSDEPINDESKRSIDEHCSV